MMKISSKRRRTQAQIKEEKAAKAQLEVLQNVQAA